MWIVPIIRLEGLGFAFSSFTALRKVWCIVYLIEAWLRPPRRGNYNWEAVIFPKLMSWEILDRSQQHVSYFPLRPYLGREWATAMGTFPREQRRWMRWIYKRTKRQHGVFTTVAWLVVNIILLKSSRSTIAAGLLWIVSILAIAVGAIVRKEDVRKAADTYAEEAAWPAYPHRSVCLLRQSW